MADHNRFVESQQAWEASLAEQRRVEVERLKLEVARVRLRNLTVDALNEGAVAAKQATADALRALESAQRTQAAYEHVQRERVAGTTLEVGAPIRSLR